MRHTSAIKALTQGLLELHHKYLPGRTDTILRKIEAYAPANIVEDTTQMHSSATYSLFTQTAQKREQMGEETFYSGLRANIPLAVDNFNQIDDVIKCMLEQRITATNPYTHFVLGVGNPTTNAVNHYVSLFAYRINNDYVIRFFNPLPNDHYEQFRIATQAAVDRYQAHSPYRVTFINHAQENLQDNQIFCAEYSSLYLYLSALEYDVKHKKRNANSPRTEHDLFFENLSNVSFSKIVKELERKSSYTVFSELLLQTRGLNLKRIEVKMREMNLEYWAQKVTIDELKEAVRIILNDIEKHYTQAERYIIALSLAAILTGFYVQIASVSVAGTAVICITGCYGLRVDNDLRLQLENFMSAIDEAFMLGAPKSKSAPI